MLIIIFVIIALSILILAHEAGHFFTAKAFGMKVDEFGFGFPPEMVGIRLGKLKLPPRILGIKRGEVLYSVNWIPFGGFVKIAGETDPTLFEKGEGQAASDISAEEKLRLFKFQAWWRRALVLAAGVIINFILGWLLLSTVFMVGTPPALLISGVQEGSPAAEVGLAPNDIIKGYTKADEFIGFINSHRGEAVTLNVFRNGQDVEFSVVPRIETAENEGALGVALVEGGVAREGVFAALYDGLKTSVKVFGLTVTSFLSLIKNLIFHGRLLDGVVGPVGIVSVASETSQLGFMYLLVIISQISISLAVVNFMPFPALDGGQFFLVLIEKIKGSPLFSKKTEGAINALGFLFLVLLIVLISVRDIRAL